MSTPPDRDTSDGAPGSSHSGGTPTGSGSVAGSFVGTALAVEGILGLVGWGLGLWSGQNWEMILKGTSSGLLLGVLGGLGMVAVHLGMVMPGGPRNPLYRTIYRPLHRTLRAPLRDARLFDLVLLALASGIGEEMLFRGWLQTQTNIWVASVAFGACHVWGRASLPYGLYATGMGFVLGGLFAHTGQNLWAPASAHVVNNLLGFLALKYDWLSPRRSP